MIHFRRWLAGARPPAPALVAASLLTVCVSGCITLTAEPRALLEHNGGGVEVRASDCRAARAAASVARTSDLSSGLDPRAIRVFTWNIHKEGDRGWQSDLTAFSASNDIVLLQETVLQDSLRRLIEGAGLRWVMASSFLYRDVDIGVLTATRIAPIASCTQRIVEPLLRLPKSAVVTWFPIAGRAQTLAVVNIHAINFSLSLGAYRAQFAAIGDALADHDGPIVVAGDFNTWTDRRTEAVRELAERLGLTEVAFADDRRRVFFGHELDHILTRQMAVVASSAMPVTSSDHNPVAATLRIEPE